MAGRQDTEGSSKYWAHITSGVLSDVLDQSLFYHSHLESWLCYDMTSLVMMI